MLDELIKELETNPVNTEKESPSFGKKLRYLRGLFDTTEQIGKLVLNIRGNRVEKYFCYDRRRNGGHVIAYDKTGLSMASYGNISKEEFIKKHFKIEPSECEYGNRIPGGDKRVPYPLMAVPLIFLPGAFYAAKKIYEHKKEKDSE
jgi:hypothetical protein